MNDIDSKDIYLKKGEEIVGLHSIGHKGPYTYTKINPFEGTEVEVTTDFMAIESWGNEYDSEYNMLGKGSFRIFCDIEEAAKSFEADGWTRFERELK
jgi:hypothetical protein